MITIASRVEALIEQWEDKVEIFGELSEGDKILKMASEEITEGTDVPPKNQTKK